MMKTTTMIQERRPERWKAERPSACDARKRLKSRKRERGMTTDEVELQRVQEVSWKRKKKELELEWLRVDEC